MIWILAKKSKDIIIKKAQIIIKKRQMSGWA
jgi:hypothetical protein